MPSDFKIIMTAVEHLGGAMFADNALITLEQNVDIKSGGTTKTTVYYKKVVKDKMMEIAFIK